MKLYHATWPSLLPSIYKNGLGDPHSRSHANWTWDDIEASRNYVYLAALPKLAEDMLYSCDFPLEDNGCVIEVEIDKYDSLLETDPFIVQDFCPRELFGEKVFYFRYKGVIRQFEVISKGAVTEG